MNDPETSPPESDEENYAYRKLIRSMIMVIVLLFCAALLLALGECAN